jgi:hypothetical protein
MILKLRMLIKTIISRELFFPVLRASQLGAIGGNRTGLPRPLNFAPGHSYFVDITGPFWGFEGGKRLCAKASRGDNEQT